MSKPIWCPIEIWDKATAILHGYSVFTDGIQIATVAADISRAIMAAEKRGEEREREACAVLCVEDAVKRRKNAEECVSGSWEWGIPEQGAMAQLHKSVTATTLAAAIRKRGEG